MKKNRLVIYCDECYGSGEYSSCCQEGVENHKCITCGKFCNGEICGKCEGRGSIEYRINDDVEVFICKFSSKCLKEQLNYYPNKKGQFKTFKGKIIDILDYTKLKIYIKYYKKEIIIHPDEVELI